MLPCPEQASLCLSSFNSHQICTKRTPRGSSPCFICTCVMQLLRTGVPSPAQLRVPARWHATHTPPFSHGNAPGTGRGVMCEVSLHNALKCCFPLSFMGSGSSFSLHHSEQCKEPCPLALPAFPGVCKLLSVLNSGDYTSSPVRRASHDLLYKHSNV